MLFRSVLQNGLPLYAEGGEVHMAKGGSTIKNIEDYIRQREGEYGLKRLQRAADEIPGLDKMYTERALREAFGGDNAKALMTMNPADFEKYSIPLKKMLEVGPKMAELAKQGVLDKSTLTTDDYIKYLAKLRGFEEDRKSTRLNSSH